MLFNAFLSFVAGFNMKYYIVLAIVSISCISCSGVSNGDCYQLKKATICKNLTLKANEPLRIKNYTATLILYPPLKELPSKIFAELQNLRILVINFTLVERIYSDSFSGLTNLQELDLYWNQIHNIPVDAFYACSNLIYLNLGGNNLENINVSTLERLKYLKKLIISRNLLSSVPNLSNLKNLELLDLSKNRIKSLREESFEGLLNLITLNLKGNKLDNIERNAFYGLKRLQYLNLERNNLENIDEINVCENLPNLKEIRINMNQFDCQKLMAVISNFLSRKVFVPEGLAEIGPISYHGMFCLPKVNSSN